MFLNCVKNNELLKSSIGLRFFKNCHKDIKVICKEDEEDFWAFLSLKTKPMTQVFITDIQAKRLYMH